MKRRTLPRVPIAAPLHRNLAVFALRGAPQPCDMARILRLLFCSQVLALGSVLATRSHARASGGEGGVVTLTDLNFDEELSNGKPWMITASAHYCQLTHEMDAAFNKIAKQLQPDISVGRIDGTADRGLISRFQLKGYHAIYHINGTETRQYCDGHGCEGKKLSSQQLTTFAREGWKGMAPRTGCSSPVSKCGRAVGEITKLPARFKSTYFYLHDERHFSDLTLFAGMLAVPVAIGLSFICALDAYYSRRPLAPPHVHHHHHD